jgi:hypothetical protein
LYEGYEKSGGVIGREQSLEKEMGENGGEAVLEP